MQTIHCILNSSCFDQSVIILQYPSHKLSSTAYKITLNHYKWNMMQLESTSYKMLTLHGTYLLFYFFHQNCTLQ